MVMIPTVVRRMAVSLRQLYADFLLSMAAERRASGAGSSRSDAGAEAVPRRLQAVVRPVCG